MLAGPFAVLRWCRYGAWNGNATLAARFRAGPSAAAIEDCVRSQRRRDARSLTFDAKADVKDPKCVRYVWKDGPYGELAP